MARKSKKPALGRLELQIMQVIWKRGSSTVNEVQAALKSQLAYTTVQTVMNILARKGKLSRQLQGRAYLYSAKISETRALGQSVRDLIDRMFSGSSEQLVMSLLKNRQIDPRKLEQLTERFNREEESGQ